MGHGTGGTRAGAAAESRSEDAQILTWPALFNVIGDVQVCDRWHAQAILAPAAARMFGGQLLAQAAAAAARTVDPQKLLISMQAVFLRPGNCAQAVTYDVERVRDGRSYSTRGVRASQAGRELLRVTGQWQRAEDGPEHDERVPLPARPGPQPLPYPAPGVLTSGLDLRWVDTDTGRGLWFKCVDPGSGEPDAAGPGTAIWRVVYVSDLWLLDTLLRRHGLRYDDPGVRASSIDYTARFHRPPRGGEWLYLASSTPIAADGRGLVEARVRDQSGRLLATIGQEVSVRANRNRAEGKTRPQHV